MDTSNLKKYAPQARMDFIKAVTDRAAFYGITADEVLPATVEGDVALIGDKAFPKEVAAKRKKLEQRIIHDGFAQVMEAMAYTWFNRLVAIRYMELHGYLDHGYRVLSHPEGQSTPEILEHAEHLELSGLKRETVIDLKLDGTKESELYRLILLAQCNALHKAMPFLFESINDETELLLPDNLLHSDSLIRNLVNEVPEEDWNEVEVIGWLYQFYISDKKEEVIGKVVKSEDIPAATQLFTPNWIVRYMLHNTLGRQWMATYPNSPLKEQMEYYIEPAEQTPEVVEQLKEITPENLNPEEMTFLDPACGSGHILVEAYDLFKAIYLERGYRAKDIPQLILEKNLYGLEIDDRAAQLAAFALLMKAREDDRRIFDREVTLNVLAIQDSPELSDEDLEPFINEELTLSDYRSLLDLFEDGKTFGSLISIPEELAAKLSVMESQINTVAAKKGILDQTFVEDLLPIVAQAQVLVERYDAVVANPPYMGSKGMNPHLKKFAKDRYPNSKSDLFAIFVERIMELNRQGGFIGLMTPFTWMFLSSFEKLRLRILKENTLTTLVRPEYHAFFESAFVPICGFTICSRPEMKFKGSFIDLQDFYGADVQPVKALEAIQNPNCGWFYTARPDDFLKIPGSPIAYSVSDRIRDLFSCDLTYESKFAFKAGISTGKNESFILLWTEVSFDKIKMHNETDYLYTPHNKGGESRKWMGNCDYVLKYSNKHIEQMEKNLGFRHDGKEYYFQAHVGWSKITSSRSSFRYYREGFTFDSAGLALFATDNDNINDAMGFLNSKISAILLSLLNPSLNLTPQVLKKLPFKEGTAISRNIQSSLYKKSKSDWDSYETSWGFSILPLLNPSYHQSTLKTTYSELRIHGREFILDMQRLEQENNLIFIEAYGLQDELTPEVPLNEITLTCNPHYRFKGDKNEEELETLLLEDTMQELISYSIGCMMGRYSLDQPGLVYAQSGNRGFDSTLKSTFPADDDGIIPLTNYAWFEDDAAFRFDKFIATAWDEEHLDENLRFVAESIQPKKGESPRETIRRYLATGFFKNHMQMYKKRPIYWLFSSGKQRAFQCLVYLHRYNEGTLARMRTEYVIPLQGMIASRIDQLEGDLTAATSTAHGKKIEKERNQLLKQQTELQQFDEKLRHYADQRIDLDLDDGVKVNYGKFGDLLAEVKAITGKKPEVR